MSTALEPEPAAARRIRVTIRVGHGEDHRIDVSPEATLLDIMDRGAELSSTTLLPDPEHPLDQLHDLLPSGQPGPAIENLEQTIEHFLKDPHRSRNFEIVLVRAIQVNTRWAVATTEQMTPRQILDSPGIGLDPNAYELYRYGSNDPLPLDVLIPVQRGERFEAQRKGQYGDRAA